MRLYPIQKYDAILQLYACAQLHNHYMEILNKPKTERLEEIMVQFQTQHFHRDRVSLFPIGWEDLFDLYNLTVLDARILRCFVLRLQQ